MYMRKLFFIFTFFMKYNLFPPRDSAPFIFFLLGVPFAPPREVRAKKKKKEGRANKFAAHDFLFVFDESIT